MKARFNYNGTSLTLALTVEDDVEQAAAALMGKMSDASLHIKYGSYGYRVPSNIEEIVFTMTEPVPTPEPSSHD